jgi:hypothetical protein
MARITADSVIDEQLDRIYEEIIFVIGLHSPDGEGSCRTCLETSPCWTLDAVERAKAQFVRQVFEEGSCRI